MPKTKIQVRPARGGQCRTVIIGRNGEVMFTSEALRNEKDALSSVRSLLKDVFKGNVEIEVVNGKAKK